MNEKEAKKNVKIVGPDPAGTGKFTIIVEEKEKKEEIEEKGKRGRKKIKDRR